MEITKRDDGSYDVVCKSKLRLIPNENDGGFTVESDSGHIYNVSYYCPADEDDSVNVWSCNCPAGQHGRDCKHIAAAIAVTDAMMDE
jgi:hypothetical protein